MANRRYDDYPDDEYSRARSDRDSAHRCDDTTSWRPRGYDQPRAREQHPEERFRAGSHWDQDRRDSERAAWTGTGTLWRCG